MIVCICEGVSDRTIKRTIDDGAGCIKTVGRKCMAGTDCGRCRAMIRDMLRDAGVAPSRVRAVRQSPAQVAAGC